MEDMSIEKNHEMWDITDSIHYVNSTEKADFFEYTPQTQGNNNSNGHQIRIDINALDIFTNPSESYISITGQIARVDDNAYDAANEITLINNARMYFFSLLKYELGSTTLESINLPGQVTSMIGYATYPDDFSVSSGLKTCWSKETSTAARSGKYQGSPVVAAVAAGIAVPAIAAGYFSLSEHPGYNQGFATRKGHIFNTTPLGCFTFHIPLKHILGFASGHKQVIYGMKHTLTLTRADNMEALYRNGAAADGKVLINDISWNMLKVKPSPEKHMIIMSIIAEKRPLNVFYQTRTSE